MDINEDATASQPVKVPYLVSGSLFLGIVALAVSLDTGAIAWSGTRYLGPALLIAVGAVGLLATLVSNRLSRRPRRQSD